MTSSTICSAQNYLIIGDLLIMAVVTIAGFTSHEELHVASLPRMLGVFIPRMIAWLAILPFSRVYSLNIAIDARQLWRPFWAMVICMPLAMLLRSVWLNRPLIPVFVLVMAGTSAVLMFAWRASYVWLGKKRIGVWTKSS